MPDNAAFTFGTGDFTVETWVYPNALATTVIAGKYTSSPNTGWSFELNSTGFPNIWLVGTTVATSSVAVSVGRWNHIAVTRSGTDLKIFVNGVQTASVTNSTNITASGLALYINSGVGTPGTIGLNGFYSNLRIVKGTAVYTSAFTPSTTPLTAITNTSLLTCQSNRIRDNSTNAFTITKAGDVKVLTFGPFTETDTTTGSGFFDGSGDYLTIADNAALEPSNLDWTIEAWIYPTSNASNTYYAWFSKNGTGYGAFYFAQRNLGFYIFLSYTGSAWDVHGVNSNYSCGTMTLNAWNHVAITRSGQTVRGFLNGVLGTTITLSSAGVSLVDQANPLMLGAQSNGAEPVAGYMSNFRYVRGTSLYTSNFTPPTSQLTAVANTAVLTLQNFQSINNHTFIDESALRNNVTRNGNPSMGSFSPFSPAGWSNFFDGTGDYLSLSARSFAGDFTLEAWIYPLRFADSGGSSILFCSTSPNHQVDIKASGATSYYNGSTSASSATGRIVLNTWQHYAICRSGTTTRIFVNGVLVASNLSDSGTRTFTFIGQFPDGNNYYFQGYMSNVRWATTARYTAAFTPPSSILSSDANTSLLTCQSNRFIDNSTNNFTITKNGDTKVVNFSPFKPTDVYSLATHGGAAYFDGSDYLQTNSTDSGLITTGPFTIELWIYPLSLNTTILSRFYWQTGDNGGWILSTNSSGFIVFGYSTGVWNTYGGTTTTTNPIKINEWSHIAITRDSSNTLRVFVNGLSSVTPLTVSQSLDTVAVQQAAVQPRTFRVAVGGLGDGALSGYYTGYISSVKIQTGVAKYTANSTPALQTFPNESGINYLSNMNTMGIVDITSRNVMETIGNVSLNSTKKFGTGSLYFDGTGDVIRCINTTERFNFGTGDFTIECWVNLINYSTERPILYKFVTWSSNVDFAFRVDGSTGLVRFMAGDSTPISITSNSAIPLNQWVHLAATRSSGVTRIFVNGTLQTSTHTGSVSIPNESTSLFIGGDAASPSVSWNGYIDDLRITSGYARYTANFTAPTLTFLTQ